MASPGKSDSQALAWVKEMLALRSQPQLGVGGWVPRPRKLRVASTMIDVAMPSVVVTMMGARQFGRTWRKRIQGSRTPRARQASTYSFSLMDSTLPRTRRAEVGVRTVAMAPATLIVPMCPAAGVDMTL